MSNPFTDPLDAKINALTPDVATRIRDLPGLEPDIARKLLKLLLGHACSATHIGVITWARQKIAQIPNWWLEKEIIGAAHECLDLSDEWEYRRFLELICESSPRFKAEIVQEGLRSSNLAVREAAEDELGR